MFQSKVVQNLLLAVFVLIVAFTTIRYLNDTHCDDWKELKINDSTVYKERNCSK